MERALEARRKERALSKQRESGGLEGACAQELSFAVNLQARGARRAHASAGAHSSAHSFRGLAASDAPVSWACPRL